jgi:16S rRNA (guanine966-N2)-methyltransferase
MPHFGSRPFQPFNKQSSILMSPAKTKASSVSRNNARNQLRIIGGSHRSRVVRFADAPGLRPTPDRVRETLFNWLGQNLAGKRCLDLFCGSGALAFEAASRGAEQVIAIELDKGVALTLKQQAQALELGAMQVVQSDAIAFLKSNASSVNVGFDVVFIDPPYASNLQLPTLQLLQPWLGADAQIYVESGEPLTLPDDLHEFAITKQGKAGAVHYCLLSAQPTEQ